MTAADHQIQAFQDFLLQLFDVGDQWFRANQTQNDLLTIANRFDRFDKREELERSLPQKIGKRGGLTVTDHNGIKKPKFVYLKPPTNSLREIYFLNADWTLDILKPQLTMYLSIFAKKPNEPGFGYICYRFEMPDQRDEHGYFHVQPTKEPGYHVRIPIAEALDWLSNTHPAIPIPGKSIASLCTTLAVSLYGADIANSLLTWARSQSAKNEIKEIVNCCGMRGMGSSGGKNARNEGASRICSKFSKIRRCFSNTFK